LVILASATGKLVNEELLEAGASVKAFTFLVYTSTKTYGVYFFVVLIVHCTFLVAPLVICDHPLSVLFIKVMFGDLRGALVLVLLFLV